jgi:ribosome-binding ATPase YchF (GTP1/OBG family)
LENEIGLSKYSYRRKKSKVIEHLDFLLVKPVIIVINVDEEQLVKVMRDRKKY